MISNPIILCFFLLILPYHTQSIQYTYNFFGQDSSTTTFLDSSSSPSAPTLSKQPSNYPTTVPQGLHFTNVAALNIENGPFGPTSNEFSFEVWIYLFDIVDTPIMEATVLDGSSAQKGANIELRDIGE
ncbi:unnamed protein product [Moneuplotes crassus]|uniref:Legume lectin domain-containing protein n=1 Tax=Euplotes crassus TaxID=5936 RepID=A0AAD1U6A4_EUPCR|nr:unnamed protein product [Moneuplotes crassus]